MTAQSSSPALYIVDSINEESSNEGDGSFHQGDGSVRTSSQSHDQFMDIFQTNAGYVEEMYSRFLSNPSLVTPEWRAYFAGFKGGFAACLDTFETMGGLPAQSRSSQSGTTAPGGLNVEAAVYQLTQAYKDFGHLKARINPLANSLPQDLDSLRPETFGLTPRDLDSITAVGVHFGWAPMPVRQFISELESVFCASVGIEYGHLMSASERAWLDSRISHVRNFPDPATQLAMFEELAKADAFEKTLGTKFLGQKRFSIEGADALIPAIETALDHGAHLGVKEYCLGMAHRGRLNILINVLQKPAEKLYAEFEGRRDAHSFGDGDVKYHCGWETDRTTRSGHEVRVSLSFNPSHLEFVNAVTLGEVRAIQDCRWSQDRRKVVPILIHGDAAFAGQGVVYEAMQMVDIPGQRVGGCIHIVANNQVGFTTNPDDSRSSFYCTDIGKAFSAPIFHVNAEALESLHEVMKLAMEFRDTFGRDVIIDLVCFRRHGHNEADEPNFTQPLMYQVIKDKPSPYVDYMNRLVAENPSSFNADELQSKYDAMRSEMNAVYDAFQAKPGTIDVFPPSRRVSGLIHGDEASLFGKAETAVGAEHLVTLGHRALEIPDGFSPNKKVSRIIIGERKSMLDGEKPLDWGMGEFLCYASLLDEGYSVRICGQDAGRGTFSHRHAVLVDSENEKRFLGLSQVGKNGARIEIIDSLLSEAAALGFEYGFAVRSLNSLTIWEAQFGDFCNGAQVIIDQFLVSGESKWSQMQGLVLLLPHGYEGQGPEHSSGRLERFMQLAAEGNMQICIPTRSSQIFHLLRRQVKRNVRKPLVVMTPKSFLRSPKAACAIQSLASGTFLEVLGEERTLDASSVERIVLCSGKVALDAISFAEMPENADQQAVQRTAIIRLEQLYPLHKDMLAQELAKYPKAKSVFWVQEEPKNMGAYFVIRDDIDDVLRAHKLKLSLKYVGRSKRASPAVGASKVHAKEFEALMNAIFHAKDSQEI